MTTDVGCKMIGRTDIVDILVRRNVPEVKAWEIAMSIEPDYLEAMNKTTVWREVDELLSAYIRRMRDAA